MCPNTFFSHMTYSLRRYDVKDELDCFNCKAGGGGGGEVSQIIRFNVHKIKESNCNPRFREKNQLAFGEYLTMIKKLKTKCSQGTHCCIK